MLWKSLVAEAVGVFALCFVGGGAIYADALLGDRGPGLLGIALAHGLILGIMVTATMNVSGGHINPAVTLAMLVTGRISIVKALAYIAAQIAGGVVAGFLLSGVIFTDMTDSHGQFLMDKTKAATPHYSVQVLGRTQEHDTDTARGGSTERFNSGKAARKALLIEGVLTFLLVFAVFGTAVDPRHPNVGGFGIGLTVAVDILVGGPLTGAAMNPARFIGTGFMFAGEVFTQQLWVYCVGPILGAIVAALFYHHLILPRPGDKPS